MNFFFFFWEYHRDVRTNSKFSTLPDAHSLASLLQSCDTHSSLNQGRQIHLVFLKKGLLGSSVIMGNRLMLMYVKCGNMSDVHALFQEMPLRNSFSWNTMIEGYMKSGNHRKSLEFFRKMPEKNDFSWKTVISGFAKAGLLDYARQLFDDMPIKTVVTCTLMIDGYAKSGHHREALKLFKHLSLTTLGVSHVDKFVFTTIFRVCTDLVAFGCGKQIHARIVVGEMEFDPALASSMINFYGKCGDLESASHVFNMRKEPDDYSLSTLIISYANFGRMDDATRVFNMSNNPSAVLWSSMISGYVCNNDAVGALSMYSNMRGSGALGDSSTLVSVLSACSLLGIAILAKQIHANACKAGMIDDIVVASALLDSYSKCGSFDDACKLFRELKTFDTIMLNCMITTYLNCGKIEEAKHIFRSMPVRSLISWNSMLVGLCQNGFSIEALDLFQEMNKTGLKLDKFNLASAITACAGLSSLEFGEQIFSRAVVVGLEKDEIVSNSFLDFYCKCGLVRNGRKVFDNMMKVDQVPWNSMLMGYATNGHGPEALELFRAMQQAGVTPCGITFTAVLSACGHCGLVEEGRRWFSLMERHYKINPSIEHYACLIDLFSRAGCLEEAMALIDEMPFKADAGMLSSILRGCMADGNKTLGKKVTEAIMKLDRENSGAYVQLSNILASYGEWQGSADVRKAMRREGVQKNPGYSWSDC